MKLLNTMLIFMTLLIALAVTVSANPANKSSRTPAPHRTLKVHGSINETEPNGHCTTANSIAIGDLVTATIDVGDDMDYFELSVNAGTSLMFSTILSIGEPGYLQDSILTLYADDCSTVLDFNDDSFGRESTIIFEFPTSGTYYIMVEGYDSSEQGIYQLAVETIVLTPVGDTCEDMTSIPSGAFTYTASTTGMSNDYELPVDDYGVDTPDVVFGFTLQPGENLACEFTLVGADFVIYLTADCADPQASLLAFSDDDPEVIDYTNDSAETQTISMIVDGIALGVHGGFVLTGVNGGTGYVANENSSWGDLKTLYR